MLDTDTCSYIMKAWTAHVLKRLSALPVSDVCISVITKSDLLFVVEFSPRWRQDQAALSAFLNYIEVLDFPDQASPHYARIRADLKRLGSAVEAKIGANDLFIAAHARSLGLTLVTNNTRESGRVSRLAIENWTVGS